MKKHIVSTTALITPALVGLLSQPVAAQNIDYALLKDLFGEPVTTSATGAPQRASDAPATMIIIDEAEIAKSTASDIPSLLRNYAGIEVTQYGANGFDVGIRGGNSYFYPFTLVLVNGRQVYGDQFGFVTWDALPVEMAEIQQIEVVKGPNSALFGFNAVVGVINIITKDPLHTSQIVASAEYGLDEERRLSLSALGKLTDKLAVRVSSGYDAADEFFIPGRLPDSEFRDPERLSLAGEVKYAFSPKTILTVESSYNESESLNFSPNGAALARNTEFTGIRGQLNVDSDFGLIEAMVYKNFLNSDFDAGPPFLDNRLVSFENDVLVAKLQDIITVNPKNKARIAFEYRDNLFKSEQSLSGEISFDLFAGSVMWENKTTDWLTLTAAARIDYVEFNQSGPEVADFFPFRSADFDRNVTEYSFNTAALIKPSPIDSIRLIVARGVQLPPLLNLGLAQPADAALTAFFVGDPTLPPTPAWNYEIGYDRGIEAINGQLRTAVFYREITSLNTFPNSVGGITDFGSALLQSQEIGDFESFGFEFALNGRVNDAFSWGLNYTFTDVSEDFPQNDPLEGEPFSAVTFVLDGQTPKHKINAQLGYEKDAFSANAYLRYRSSTIAPTDGTIAGIMPDGTNLVLTDIGSSFTADFRMAWQATDTIEVYAIGENLFDDGAVGSSIIETDIRGRLGVRVTF